VILAIGEDPVAALWIMIDGAMGSKYAWGYTLYYATNFIFTGLAVAVAFHARIFNIGGEGQAMLGGVGVALICIYLPLAALVVGAFGGHGGLRALWRGLGICACMAAGQARQPYRYHHDHVQFHRRGAAV
jgi:general nucleoside transport system permease protein